MVTQLLGWNVYKQQYSIYSYTTYTPLCWKAYPWAKFVLKLYMVKRMPVSQRLAVLWRIWWYNQMFNFWRGQVCFSIALWFLMHSLQWILCCKRLTWATWPFMIFIVTSILTSCMNQLPSHHELSFPAVGMKSQTESPLYESFEPGLLSLD